MTREWTELLEDLGDEDLNDVREWSESVTASTTERNESIQRARDAGHSLRAIADAAYLSVEGVRRILKAR